MPNSLNIPLVIERQNRLIQKYLGYRLLQQKYNWEDEDIRIKIFTDLANQLIVQLIHLKTLFTVWNENWWDSNFPQNNSEKEKNDYRNKYYNQIRWSLYIVFCGMLESNIRILYGHISEKDSRQMKYGAIYRELLSTLSLSDELLNLFKLANLIRNLVHNNFRFTPTHNWEPDSANFRGEKYNFIPGETYDRFGINDAMNIYEDLYDGILQIVTSEKVLEQEFIWNR